MPQQTAALELRAPCHFAIAMAMIEKADGTQAAENESSGGKCWERGRW